jgi:RsiW-degrading membrane proteinase PrsW (M82 family)
LWLIACILGIGIIIMLMGSGGLYALYVIIDTLVGSTPLNVGALLQAAGIVTLGMGIGGPLVLSGWSGWQARSSKPFDPTLSRWPWLAQIPLFAILTLLGAAISWLPTVLQSVIPPTIAMWSKGLLMPPVYGLAMAIPAIALLGLAGWGLRGVGGTQRHVTIGMVGGGCVGLSLTLLAETLVIVAAIISLSSIFALTPNGLEHVQALQQDLLAAINQNDLSGIMDLILSPIVAISVFSFLCIVAPSIEEAFKTLTIGVLGRWISPKPGHAFLLGVASGAGFALAENLLNTAAAGEGWPILGVTRVGTTAMHCLASGLIGWGWGQLWTRHRPLRLLAAYTAAVTLHGLWNTLVLGIGYTSLMTLAQDSTTLWSVSSELLSITLLVILLLLAIAFFIALYVIAQRLASQTDHS